MISMPATFPAALKSRITPGCTSSDSTMVKSSERAAPALELKPQTMAVGKRLADAARLGAGAGYVHLRQEPGQLIGELQLRSAARGEHDGVRRNRLPDAVGSDYRHSFAGDRLVAHAGEGAHAHLGEPAQQSQTRTAVDLRGQRRPPAQHRDLLARRR